MSERQSAFLQEMGLGPRWMRRRAGPAAMIAEPAAASVSVVTQAGAMAAIARETAPAFAGAPGASAAPVAAMGWQELQQSVAACRNCSLCETRSKTVFGSGRLNAKWLFIGAAPNADDEAEAMPLAGVRGSLFNNMLQAIGLQGRQDVYVTNLLKCRPVHDTVAPAGWAEQQAACQPYLERQIALLAPAVIIALGADVAAVLLGDASADLAGMRGKLHEFAGLPLIVTHAPADMLLSPAAKAGAWRDLCMASACDAAHS